MCRWVVFWWNGSMKCGRNRADGGHCKWSIRSCLLLYIVLFSCISFVEGLSRENKNSLRWWKYEKFCTNYLPGRTWRIQFQEWRGYMSFCSSWWDHVFPNLTASPLSALLLWKIFGHDWWGKGKIKRKIVGVFAPQFLAYVGYTSVSDYFKGIVIDRMNLP